MAEMRRRIYERVFRELLHDIDEVRVDVARHDRRISEFLHVLKDLTIEIWPCDECGGTGGEAGSSYRRKEVEWCRACNGTGTTGTNRTFKKKKRTLANCLRRPK